MFTFEAISATSLTKIALFLQISQYCDVGTKVETHSFVVLLYKILNWPWITKKSISCHPHKRHKGTPTTTTVY